VSTAAATLFVSQLADLHIVISPNEHCGIVQTGRRAEIELEGLGDEKMCGRKPREMRNKTGIPA
jgi:hypothetical protein